jgi:hypothetical protein
MTIGSVCAGKIFDYFLDNIMLLDMISSGGELETCVFTVVCQSVRLILLKTAPFLSLGDVVGRRGVIFTGNFIGKHLSSKETPQYIYNKIVLAAAFIQAFSTGIPMFMVIATCPRFLASCESRPNRCLGWTFLLGVWLCFNVTAPIHWRSCSHASSWATCGIIRCLFPVRIRLCKHYRNLSKKHC